VRIFKVLFVIYGCILDYCHDSLNHGLSLFFLVIRLHCYVISYASRDNSDANVFMLELFIFTFLRVLSMVRNLTGLWPRLFNSWRYFRCIYMHSVLCGPIQRIFISELYGLCCRPVQWKCSIYLHRLCCRK
jgi:hypothetical protein